MDKTIPKPAAALLDFIGGIEAPEGHVTIYGNNQSKLSRPIVVMTLNEIIALQPSWTKQFGSSAAGRYQFMRATLQGLMKELALSGTEIFDADFQDRLSYHLLRRRGYESWINGKMTRSQFMIELAKEWASIPVPYDMQGSSRKVTRGQSYYAGDGKNKSLVTPERVEAALDVAFAMRAVPDLPPVIATPKPVESPVTTPPQPVKLSFWQRFLKALRGEA